MEEELTLSAHLEQDRELVMAQLRKERTPDRVTETLEKETDRLMYRAGAYPEAQAEAAQGMLQVLKNALPLVGCVSEAEVWTREGEGGKPSGRKVPLPAILCLAAGIACGIAGLMGRPSGGSLSLFSVIWAAAACALLVLGGYFAGRGKGSGRKERNEQQVQQTFLADPERIWHILQGTLLGADHSLEGVRDRALLLERGNAQNPPDAMHKEDLQFFAELLEHAYALRRRFPGDETLGEQVENIRYYLHRRGIETEDYSDRSASWFEILPAQGQHVTIRPALLKDGALVMKGISS